jgi:hypothetical protein
LVVAGQFGVFNKKTVIFDTISYTASSNENKVGGIFLFESNSNRLIGLYPSKSIGFSPTIAAVASYVDNQSFGIGGAFSKQMTFSGTSNYIEALDRFVNCTNTDLFFSLFDRSGKTIAEDVIYTSSRLNSAVFAMSLKDSILYIGGYVGDSVYVNGLDTFVTRGTDDAFIAAYNVGLITSLEETANYIKADNGILGYPNPTEGQVTLMGKPVSQEAQLYSISGQLVDTYS